MPFAKTSALTRPSFLFRLQQHLRIFDPILLLILFVIMCLSLLTLFSASFVFEGRFLGHLRNLSVAFLVMWVAAMVPLSWWVRLALPLFIGGLLLLFGVAAFGLIKNGARRWLDLGIVLQPSEIMKIAAPMMLAAFFHRYGDYLKPRHFFGAFLILLVPFALIVRQPDLGTATLVLMSGFQVIFLAGLSWRLIVGLGVVGVVSAPFAWNFLHGYQQQRILTFLNPESDALDKGFHIIQSVIAIGSGGFIGKGWLKGTQTHLQFIPERTTDFIFAAFSEEFGFIGAAILLLMYFLLIGRAFFIASHAPTLFSRLLSGSIAMQLFTYVFVNIGMVMGIVPVVGVPLPFMSYGGTALMTLALSVGILMGVNRARHLIQT